MAFYGHLWLSIVICSILWLSMAFYRYLCWSMTFSGYLLLFMVICSILWLSMAFYGYLCLFLVICSILWLSISIYGILWLSTVIYCILWLSMVKIIYCYLWRCIAMYGYLWLCMLAIYGCGCLRFLWYVTNATNVVNCILNYHVWKGCEVAVMSVLRRLFPWFSLATCLAMI